MWATVPGRLDASLTHQFQFFNLDGIAVGGAPQANLSLSNTTVTLQENLAYENFIFDAKKDKVDFNTNSKFNITIENKNDFSLDQINQGLLELLNSLSNPPQYAQGLSAVNILLNKIFVSSDDFIIKLFTAYAYDYMIKDKTQVLNTILRSFPEDRANLIYGPNNTLSLGNIAGLYEWIKLIGDDEKIANANWPKEQFNMTKNEVTLIVGKQSYLYSLFYFFNNKLGFNFDCKVRDKCGVELIFRQLNDMSVTKSIGITDFKALCNKINSKLYPYNTSPEFLNFYLQQNSSLVNMTEYQEDIVLDDDQYSKLFYTNETTLLDSKNIIDLLIYYSTGNLYDAYNRFSLRSYKQLGYLTNYIFDFLVNELVVPKINTLFGQDQRLTHLSTAFTSLLGIAVEKSYPLLIKNTKVSVVSKIFERKIHDLNQTETFCLNVIENSLNFTQNDTQNFCSVDEVNMKSYKSFKNWLAPHECFVRNLTDCKEEEKAKLRTLTNLTDEQINKVYQNQNFTRINLVASSSIQTAYNCQECSEEYLAKLQFLQSRVTSKPPKIIEDEAKYSISYWDKEDYPFPVELGYFMYNKGCYVNNCTSENNLDLIYGLYNSSDLAYFDYDKILLQKAHSLFFKDVTSSKVFDDIEIYIPAKYFSGLISFIWYNMVKNDFITEYTDPIDFLSGYNKNEDDDYFLGILKHGSFYEYFKPGQDYVTGFNIDFKNNKTKYSDKFSMSTGAKSNELDVRKINSINNLNLINTAVKVYSPISNDTFEKNIPLYNNKLIKEDLYIIDGFQFSYDREVIHYYDPISSRLLKFDYKTERDFNPDYSCDSYVLSPDVFLDFKETNSASYIDSIPEIATVYDKFNKPYVISHLDVFKHNDSKSFPGIKIPSSNNITETRNTNFICVDKFSDMVLQFDISLLYSINTGDMNKIIGKLPSNTIIPVFKYNRKYRVSNEAYKSVFPNISKFFNVRMIILIVGIIAVVIFMVLALYFCFKYKNSNSGGIFMDEGRLIDNFS